MEVLLENDGTIRCGKESYAPWPRFRTIGVRTRAGRWNAWHLKDIIETDDLLCWTWRKEVPSEVLRALRLFPNGFAELLETAQINPSRFVELSRTNPALLAVISAYWAYNGWRRMPRREVRDLRRSELLRMRSRDILGALHFPPRRECARILGKIDAPECCEFLIELVLSFLFSPEKRICLRHLRRINAEVVWLLRMPEPVLNGGIIKLAAECPECEAGSVRQFVSSIINKRLMLNLYPVWPYSNNVTTWSALISAEARMAVRCGMLPEKLPAAPVLCSSAPIGLAIAPLTTTSEVRSEAAEMRNCCVNHLEAIHLGERFIYRIFSPERATLLLAKRAGVWAIEEVALFANSGAADSMTIAMVRQWMERGTRDRVLDAPKSPPPDDFPF